MNGSLKATCLSDTEHKELVSYHWTSNWRLPCTVLFILHVWSDTNSISHLNSKFLFIVFSRNWAKCAMSILNLNASSFLYQICNVFVNLRLQMKSILIQSYMDSCNTTLPPPPLSPITLPLLVMMYNNSLHPWYREYHWFIKVIRIP